MKIVPATFPDGLCLTSTRGIPCTFLVRSRLPRRIAPDYAAASSTPRPPRRLLLTEPAAPSPPLPCDAPSLAARAAAPPSASHRLPTPARRYSRCHGGGRETRPLLPIPHPCPARTRPTALPLLRGYSHRLLASLLHLESAKTLCPQPRGPLERWPAPPIGDTTFNRFLPLCRNSFDQHAQTRARAGRR